MDATNPAFAATRRERASRPSRMIRRRSRTDADARPRPPPSSRESAHSRSDGSLPRDEARSSRARTAERRDRTSDDIWASSSLVRRRGRELFFFAAAEEEEEVLLSGASPMVTFLSPPPSPLPPPVTMDRRRLPAASGASTTRMVPTTPSGPWWSMRGALLPMPPPLPPPPTLPVTLRRFFLDAAADDALFRPEDECILMRWLWSCLSMSSSVRGEVEEYSDEMSVGCAGRRGRRDDEKDDSSSSIETSSGTALTPSAFDEDDSPTEQPLSDGFFAVDRGRPGLPEAPAGEAGL
mmetsp:Transcript_43331/g.131833  ORF Transcript_43331/g.131833 Transcript_43331/m.131833 type:complete len:294 (+) Transcript_43331:1464-2345(+)